MGSCISGLTTKDRRVQRQGSSPDLEKKYGYPYKESKSQSLQTAEHVFRKTNPAFKGTTFLDHLRTTEYPTLDRDGHIYLDYTGGGLYAESQLRAHFELLRQNVFGNPHSLSPTSSAITELDEQARAYVLKFFNASPEEYTVIFTANATNALKLLGEAYPFAPGGEMLMLSDNHNSVHGIREFAREKGAGITYVPLTSPELRVDGERLGAALERKEIGNGDNNSRLFAYPAQSNFTGVQHPLEWIGIAQAQGWDVLLDAASFVPTNRLDLSLWHPDFVPVSFYKMFGYPSGVGCLLARKETLSRLNRPWFAGGTVWASSVAADGHVLLEENERFEDGTVNYLSLPAVQIGLSHLMGIGMDVIHKRVECLTDWLLKALLSLRHPNGKPLVLLYGPPTKHGRGGTITFNFLDPTGNIIDERIVEQRALSIHLSLRTGCFCNPGAGEAAFSLSQETLLKAFSGEAQVEIQQGKKKLWDEFLVDIGMPSGGAIRISLGLVSNFADVYRFIDLSNSPLPSSIIFRVRIISNHDYIVNHIRGWRMGGTRSYFCPVSDWVRSSSLGINC